MSADLIMRDLIALNVVVASTLTEGACEVLFWLSTTYPEDVSMLFNAYCKSPTS